MGASTELGQSSSAMSAIESRKPPPKTKQHHSHVTSFGPLDNFIVKKELPSLHTFYCRSDPFFRSFHHFLIPLLQGVTVKLRV